MSDYIQFVNHASIIIGDNKKAILTDPWYSGTAFDDGWKLLYENKKKNILNILSKITHIWISHEHPDHFSIKFFNDYYNQIKNKTFLFQFTKDKRVINFLKMKKLKFVEIKNNQVYKIKKNFNIQIEKSDFYDSALIVNLNGKKIFNINDCPIKDKKELLILKKKYGICDILLSQFSYAAWKGGKKNIKWRELAAKEKLETLKLQSKILESKITIPFASFVYFANYYNFYLNDSMNKPSRVNSYFKNEKSKIFFLKPDQIIFLNNLSKIKNNFKFWENKFKKISQKKVINIIEKHNFEELEKLFINYNSRMMNYNSKLLLKIIRYFPFVDIFKPIIIHLKDIKTKIYIDIINNIFEKTNLKADISMNSKSLRLIFLQDFGFDTLTVNGCFEETKRNSFLKFAKSFSLGNLNNLGIKFNFVFMFNIKMIILFLKKIIFAKKRLDYNYIQELE